MAYIVTVFLLTCVEVFLLSVIWNRNHVLQKEVERKLHKQFGRYGMSQKFYIWTARSTFIGFALFVAFLMLNCLSLYIAGTTI